MVVVNTPIIFTDTSQGNISSSWDFGDGTPIVAGSPVSHTFSVAGTYRVTDTITSSTGETKTCFKDVIVTPPASTTGILDVSSDPLGAEITIDNQDQSKVTRSIIQNIPAGDHSLKLTLAGYQDYTTTFTITVDGTTTLNPTLISTTPPMFCSFEYVQT
jgi:PKD repeat protein